MNVRVNDLKFNANKLKYVSLLFVARQRMSNIVWQVLSHFLAIDCH